MKFQVGEESIAALSEHGEVAISFKYDSIFEVALIAKGLGGIIFTERDLPSPHSKDYDAIDGGPSSWSSRCDVSKWGFIVARSNGKRIGGAVIAFDSGAVGMLNSRRG
jgi:hypothetical protein